MSELHLDLPRGMDTGSAASGEQPLPWGGALYRTDFLFSGPGRAATAQLSFRRHTEALAAQARERLLTAPEDVRGEKP